MSKESSNKKSLTKLKDLISKVEENQRPLAENLFERLKFMEKTLISLEKTIKKEGAVVELTNGNGFKTLSEHPAQKSYNTMIGKYNALIKTLAELIPEGDDAGDELTDFLRGKR